MYIQFVHYSNNYFNKQKSLIILRRRSLCLIISLSQQIFLVCDGDLHHQLPGTDHPDSGGPGSLCGDQARVQTPTLRRGRAHTASAVTPLLPPNQSLIQMVS